MNVLTGNAQILSAAAGLFAGIDPSTAVVTLQHALYASTQNPQLYARPVDQISELNAGDPASVAAALHPHVIAALLLRAEGMLNANVATNIPHLLVYTDDWRMLSREQAYEGLFLPRVAAPAPTPQHAAPPPPAAAQEPQEAAQDAAQEPAAEAAPLVAGVEATATVIGEVIAAKELAVPKLVPDASERGRPAKSPFERDFPARSRLAGFTPWQELMLQFSRKLFSAQPLEQVSRSDSAQTVLAYAAAVTLARTVLASAPAGATVVELRQWLGNLENGLSQLSNDTIWQFGDVVRDAASKVSERGGE